MKDTPLINRRQFVQLLVALSAGWGSSKLAASEILGSSHDEVYNSLEDPWLTLADVQEHLFPADANSPGAKDISALRFLSNMLDAPDTDVEEKDFIFKGVGWLNDLSKSTHNRTFTELGSDDKETILRTIENSNAGSRWLSLMMTYLIEALLSDPVYGGNKNRKGWEWLEHIPGFPTPDTSHVYYRLNDNSNHKTRRRTKA